MDLQNELWSSQSLHVSVSFSIFCDSTFYSLELVIYLCEFCNNVNGFSLVTLDSPNLDPTYVALFCLRVLFSVSLLVVLSPWNWC